MAHTEHVPCARGSTKCFSWTISFNSHNNFIDFINKETGSEVV